MFTKTIDFRWKKRRLRQSNGHTNEQLMKLWNEKNLSSENSKQVFEDARISKINKRKYSCNEISHFTDDDDVFSPSPFTFSDANWCYFTIKMMKMNTLNRDCIWIDLAFARAKVNRSSNRILYLFRYLVSKSIDEYH